MNATALWIPTPAGQCFAWYHAPQGPVGRTSAVLMCDPFGWNRMVLHLAYRQLAGRLAQAGFAVLRIDYPGTCDSEGHPRESARLDAWLGCLETGASRLREWSGAGELAAFGALFGGTMAALLAARRGDVTRLVLWGAYASGRAMVRSEIAATAMRSAGAERRAPGYREGDREALGFLLTAEMAGDLGAVDLAALRFPRLRSALVLPRPATATDARLAEHLASQGARVDLRASSPDDLDDVLHQNGAGHPEATGAAIVAWLAGEAPDSERGARQPAPAAAPVLLRERGTSIRESAVFIAEGRIFGIVSEPLEPGGAGTTVLFVNGGHNHRPGINRNYTEWARRLAARGHRALRIDLRGLGDSPPPRPELLGKIYTEHGTRDVLDAVRWLRESGAAQVCCVGLCAGAYQALHATLRGAPVDGIVLLNPLRFDMDNANEHPSRLARLAHRIKSRLPRGVRAWAGTERRVARAFSAVTRRQVEVCVVYNANEQHREFLEGALHPLRAELCASGRFHVELLGPSDHIFSPLWAQAEVAEALERFVERMARRPAGLP